MSIFSIFLLILNTSILITQCKSESVNSNIISRILRHAPQSSYYGSNNVPYQNLFGMLPAHTPYMAPQPAQYFQPNSYYNQPMQPSPRYQSPYPAQVAQNRQDIYINQLDSSQNQLEDDDDDLEDLFGTCGILKPKITNYVAKGESTDNKLWPWYAQVVIAGNNRSDSETFCGGTLIHKKYILTAAHCYDDLLASKRNRNTIVLFRGIDHYVRGKNGRKADQTIKIRAKNVYIHPRYIPAMSEYEARIKGVAPGPLNDVAIIELRHDNTEIYEKLMPACLPKNEHQLKLNTQCKIMGHGFMSANDEDNFVMPTILQMADVRISSNQACRDDVESMTIKSKINSDTVCIRGPIHPCVGDSGGPLVCAGETSRKILGADVHNLDENEYEDDYEPKQPKWYLCGVTSFAVSTDENDKCGQFKSAVFGKVSIYIPWIKNVISGYNMH